MEWIYIQKMEYNTIITISHPCFEGIPILTDGESPSKQWFQKHLYIIIYMEDHAHHTKTSELQRRPIMMELWRTMYL